MAPRAPQVRRGPKTHGTTTRHKARAAGFATQLASPPGPYNMPSSPGAAEATVGSPQAAPLELLGHAAHGRLEGGCCLAL